MTLGLKLRTKIRNFFENNFVRKYLPELISFNNFNQLSFLIILLVVFHVSEANQTNEIIVINGFIRFFEN